MRYERIKATVARSVYSQIIQHRSENCAAEMAAMFDAVAEKRPFGVSLQVLADRCYDIIMNYDVRCVGKLRELFPGHFPATLRKGQLIAVYDDTGWDVRIRA